MTRKTNRRTFLRAVASGLALSTAPTFATASKGGSKTKPDLPTRAWGIRKYHYKPDPKSDNFVLNEQFINRESFDNSKLRAQTNGSRTVNFDPEIVHRDLIPEEYKNPDRSFHFKFIDDAILGTFDQHMQAQQMQLSKLNTETSSTSRGGGPPHYNGPLYTYKSGDIDERTGPINLSWHENGFSPHSIKSDMLDDGWGSIYVPSGSRYIGYYRDDGHVKAEEDKHVKQEAGLVPGEQWHVRLYDIPGDDFDGHEVVGAAHRDPADHGKLPGGEQWRFSDSREKVRDVWKGLGYPIETQHVSNGSQFSTSDGFLSVIY